MKFKHALDGLKSVLKDSAILTQNVLGFFAIIGGLIIRLDHYEWLAFVICIGGVIALEIVNSVIESLCDLYTKEYNDSIKKIKDMMSAAVLVFCVAAFIVCVLCVTRRFIS